MNRDQYKNYWDKNIESWSDLYLDISHGHEKLNANPFLSEVYKCTIGKIESKLMRDRYQRTIWFLDNYVKPNTSFVDIGCGTGIFSVEALKRGARIHAVDISDTSIEVTKKNIKKHIGDTAHAQFTKIDLQKESLNASFDAALAMGVTPYIENIEAFLDNILPFTKFFYCQYTDPNRLSNRLRSNLPFLNVRNLIFHSQETIDQIYKKHEVSSVKRANFATGFIDLVITKKMS